METHRSRCNIGHLNFETIFDQHDDCNFCFYFSLSLILESPVSSSNKKSNYFFLYFDLNLSPPCCLKKFQVQYYINCEIAIWSKGKNPTLLEAMLSIGPNVSLENFIKIAPNFPDESIIEDEVIFTLSKSRSLFSLVRMEIFQEFTI